MNQRLSKANTGAELMNLSYEYNRGNSNGTLNGKTGQMTRMIDNRERNRDRAHEFDSLGRLIKAKGGLAAGATGVTANWTQDYSYDRYGNKTGTTATGVTVFGGPVQRDGLPSMSYNTATNRMNSTGWEYDLAGNMTRGQNADGVWQRYEYDAAGRLKRVLDDVGNWLQDNNYGSGRQRIFRNEPGGSGITWFVWGGDSVLAEYTSTSWGGTFTWAKSYIYAGSRLLFTATNNGAGGELKEYHHPDRLGTRMVTDPAANTLYLQSTLPFGTQFDSETTGSSNRLFTSYDRSTPTGLDYAVNRTYSPGQGRFTQTDPIGLTSATLENPQTNNLYAYALNDPVNHTDPSGLLTCFGYFVFFLSVDSETNEIISSEFAGFIPVFCWNDGPSEISGGSGQQNEGPAPLTEKQEKKLDKSIAKAKTRLTKEKCKTFLESHGISISAVENALDTHDRFFGPASTGISVEDSGLLGPGARERIENLPPGQARDSGLQVLDQSVGWWFNNGFGRNVKAAVATGADNPATVYYRSFKTKTVLHESLHIATGLNDVDLADKLGLTHNGTTESASGAIRKALKANGCT